MNRVVEIVAYRPKPGKGEAIDAAHKNPNVLAMWNKFFAVCDCPPLDTLSEFAGMFAGFELLLTE